MKATNLFVRSLALVSLGGFACSKPPAKAERIDATGISADQSAVVLEKEPEIVPAETPKEPEKVLLTNAFTVDQKLDLVIATDAAVGDGRGIDVLAAQLNILGKALSTAMDTQIHFMTNEPLVLPDLAAAKIGFIDQAVGPTDIIGLLGTLFANGFAEQYVDAAGDALAAPLAFRPGAKLEVVLFSTGNGEDDGNLAVDFDPANALKANVSAVVAMADSVESDECTIEAVGQEYIELSKKLNGSLIDVCSANFVQIFTTLTSEITKRNLSFKLAEKPADPRTITVNVNEKPATRDLWFYDGKNNAISFLSASVLAAGAKVEVKYEQAKTP